ncbi:transcriptional regulator/antitoxin, MazE [Sphaerospermopsis reniformis]|uniref:Transcriptional regulator/antitoxin, MazE n=2 Tax=Sphaerospermopsis reniformis TaxID=531300 RepID=A0A480A6Y3_9CYAN|nr:transcriptional regulator/antitoxin, MazE [Sphaerospermopsis reniformis]
MSSQIFLCLLLLILFLLSSSFYTKLDELTLHQMGKAVKTQIVKIGDSQGVFIPKTLLEQSGITSEVEIEVQGNHFIIRPFKQVRKGWEKAFIEMAER